MDKLKCCIYNCTAATTKNTRHVSLYKIRLKWVEAIRSYYKRAFPAQKFDITDSQMICGEHLRACNIRDAKAQVFFPYLKITTRRWSKTADQCTEDPDGVSVETAITFPDGAPIEVIIEKQTEEQEIETEEKKDHDHIYALSPDVVKMLKKDRARLIEALAVEKRRKDKLTKIFLCRIRDLVKTLRDSDDCAERMEHPFRYVPDDEEALEVYTGFPKRSSFVLFVDLVSPKYHEERQLELESGEPAALHHLYINEQLLLVLTRLRLDLTQKDLAYRFNISQENVAQIWKLWLKILLSVLVKESRKPPVKKNGKRRRAAFITMELKETYIDDLSLGTGETTTNFKNAQAIIMLAHNGVILHTFDLNARKTHELPRYYLRYNEGKLSGNNKKGMFIEDIYPDVAQKCKRNVQSLNEFKIVKGFFPSATFSRAELNTIWKICCLLTNFTVKK